MAGGGAPGSDGGLFTRLNRDRAIIVGGLAVLTAVSWFYLADQAAEGQGMSAFPGMAGSGSAMAAAAAMPGVMPWGPAEWASMLVMWSVMMVGMMLPGASPMVVMFATVNRRKRERGQPYVATGVFLSGYVIVWAAFSVGATAGNWALHTNALLSGMMGETTSSLIGGSLLLAAGLFQWTPMKNACLRQCRTPMGFLLSEWRDGASGALAMGLRHGIYCLGCCWLLMALLFVLGVMNLVWIAGLALFVLVEKVVPGGAWIGRAAGIGFAAWGVALLLGVI